MFPATTKAGGMCFAFPDVCKMPTPVGPIPIPFPNIAMLTQANGCSDKVKFAGAKACTQKSEISVSSGDEVGSVGGVVSGTFKGAASFKNGSGKVFVEGEKAVYLMCMTGQNGSPANVPGAQIAPSQGKVFVAP